MILPLVVGVGAAFLGPRLTLPVDRPAGQAFAYEPPPGFVEAKDAPLSEHGAGAKAWVLGAAEPGGFKPRVSVTHSARRGGVEERELAQIAAQLPETFAPEIVWVERRHETRIRPDGARVGLVEGNCTKKLLPADVGLPLEQKFRMLQIVFPDDGGTSIATAEYAEDEASKWEPIFEATISAARGVALRAPPTAGWVHAVWGSAGVVLGWLGAFLIGKGPEAPVNEGSSREPPPAGRQKRRRGGEGAGEDSDEDEGSSK